MQLTISSASLVSGLGGASPIQGYIDTALNEYAGRDERFYLERILRSIPQEIAAKRGLDSVPSDLTHAIARVGELRKEHGEDGLGSLIFSAVAQIWQLFPSHQRALRNYISGAIKDRAVPFLSPLPRGPKEIGTPFAERVKRIAEGFYEDPTHSEYAIQAVASRVFSMQARLRCMDDQVICSVFAANLRDFRMIENEQEMLAQENSARQRSQAGIDKKGKCAESVDIVKRDREGGRRPIHLEKTSTQEKGVAVSHMQGNRVAMEDTHVVEQITFTKGEDKYTADVYAIFDGHSGGAAAKLAQQKLGEYLTHHLSQPDDLQFSEKCNIIKKLTRAIVDLGEACKNQAEGGTTAAIVIKIKNKLYVINAGDSRVLIDSSLKGFIQATEDADLENEGIRKSIIGRGGLVESVRGTLRVLPVGGKGKGGLAVACALGDKDVPGIMVLPEITCFDLSKLGPSRVIIGCDGNFEVESSRTVICRANQLKRERKDLKDIAEGLVQAAYDSGSMDNLSVMVVELS